MATVTTTANRLPPCGHEAAGLTMIISMNAMVCGDMTRVKDEQFMIICKDGTRRRVQGERMAVSS